MSDQTSVYLYYDAREILLYVGITGRGKKRQDEHEAKEWWPFVAKQEIEHHPSRAVAQARETMLIRERRPPFNRHQNPDHPQLRAAYYTLFAPGARPPVLEWRCGHCGPCLDGEDSCQVNPDSRAHEPSLACGVCGSPDCVYQAGIEAGSQDGWSRARRMHRSGQRARCGHCAGCVHHRRDPDGEWSCRHWHPEDDPGFCSLCGREDCPYIDGWQAGLIDGYLWDSNAGHTSPVASGSAAVV